MVSSGKIAKGSAVQQVIRKDISDYKEPENVLDDIKKLEEEENRKKQAEYNLYRITYLKNEEEKNAAYNKRIIHAKFLNIMRKLKTEELKRSLEYLESDHDREVIRLSALIQNQYQDVNQSEDEYKLALTRHQHHVQELISLYEKRVENMEHQFREQLVAIKRIHDAELETLNDLQDEQTEEVDAQLEEMQKRKTTEYDKDYKDHSIEKKFLLNNYSNRYHVMKIEMNKEIKRLQEQYKSENDAHGKPISIAFREYETLRLTNDELNQTLEQQEVQISRSERMLAQWKAKWLNNLRESTQRNTLMRKEINQMKQFYRDVKQKMDRWRKGEARRLAQTVKWARDTRLSLEGNIAFAERLVKQGLLSQKLETELEIIGDDSQPLPQQLDDTITDPAMLDAFYKKMNKVLLDKAALSEEKAQLMEDNQKLRDMLKQYIDGISVNQDVIAKQNPLIMVESLSGTVANAGQGLPLHH
mmetsp:Transcript_9210/g.13634  ORF Transcript_9210/g.13634 Transcript_9210/m.13634 type:complete len:472 (+) Transcript_9210:125-1540(+)